MGFGLLFKKIDKFKKAADIDVIFAEIVSSKEFIEFAIELNTKGQLFDKGIDSLGVSLGEYAGTTIEGVKGKFLGKREKQQRFDHITLSDTETFYDSWEITLGGRSFLFKVSANPNRGDTNLFDDFGKDIVGYTEESLQKIIDFIRERIVPLIRRKMAA